MNGTIMSIVGGVYFDWIDWQSATSLCVVSIILLVHMCTVLLWVVSFLQPILSKFACLVVLQSQTCVIAILSSILSIFSC